MGFEYNPNILQICLYKLNSLRKRKNSNVTCKIPTFLCKTTPSDVPIYIQIGEGFSFKLHNLLIYGRILTFEVSNSRYFHVEVL
jgi:hypothetical protein